MTHLPFVQHGTASRAYWRLLLACLLCCLFLPAGWNAQAAGSDFKTTDFVAAAPTTYDHTTGGGAYDNRTVGVGDDVVESLEGGDFACGDIVTYLTAIEMEATTADPVQSAVFDYRFLADSTGQSGAALSDIVYVGVNYGAVQGGDGVGGVDFFVQDDGGSAAILTAESLTGPLFTAGSELLGTVQVTDLEPGERIIIRIDVQLACQPNTSPTGNLQARLDAGQVITPSPDPIHTGQQTIPFKQIGDLAGANEPLLVVNKTVTAENGSCPGGQTLQITAGTTVRYCYTISNPGTATLFDLVLTDDNGTPANLADDFTVTLSGLADLDGQGDLGDLAAGATARGQAQVLLDTPGLIINTATGSGNNGLVGGNLVTLSDQDEAQVDVAKRPQGEITFIKVVEGGGAQPNEWSFDLTGDAQDIAHNATVTLNTGNYTITEDGGAQNNHDYTLTTVGGVCSLNNGQIGLNVTEDGGACIITNTVRSGQIILEKATVPPGVQEPFTFTLSAGGRMALTHGQIDSFDKVTPGTHSVVEELPPFWSQTQAVCNDQESTLAHIKLAPGEILTCFVENSVLPAAIGLVKTADQTLVNPGALVTYYYTVTNQGQTPIYDLSASDDECGPVEPVLTGLFNMGDLDQDNFLEVGEAWLFTCAAIITKDTLNIGRIVGKSMPFGDEVFVQDTELVDVRPTLQVSKSAQPTTVPETGGLVTFTVVVTNTSHEEATLTALDDSDFTNLGSCNTPQTLAANGGVYTCSFTKLISGDASGLAHQNTITATVQDDEQNQASASDDAIVGFGDVLPSVRLDKTANPAARLEPGGLFTFSLTIHNLSDEPVKITSLTDSYPLSPACTALINSNIPAQGQVMCEYTTTLTTPGDHINTANLIVVDDEQNQASDNAQATVTITDAPSSLQVEKSASPPTLVEPGGQVTFVVTVTNSSPTDQVTLTTVADDADNNGVIDTNDNASAICDQTLLAPGAVAICTFIRQLTGVPGDLLTDEVTVSGQDDDRQPLSAQDDATVAILNANSTLVVDKQANPASLPEPGGPVTFTLVVTNTSSVDAITLDKLADTIFQDVTSSGHDGILSTTCSVPQLLAPNGDSYTCSFVALVNGNADNNHQNLLAVSGRDDDNEAVAGVDDAQVTITDTPSAIQVIKRANPTQVVENGDVVTYTVIVSNTSRVDQVTIKQVVDDRFGNVSDPCSPSLPATLAPGAAIICTFSGLVTGNAGDHHTNEVTASGQDDDQQFLSAQDRTTVIVVNTPATLKLTKSANPTSVLESGGNVTYTIVVENTSTADSITVNQVNDDRFDNISASCIPPLPHTLKPGEQFTCQFARFLAGDVGSNHTNLATATGIDDDGQGITAGDDAVVSFRDAPSAITVTKTAKPTGVPQSGGLVTFQVRVENISAADSVTLNSLNDSIYGNVAQASNPKLAGSTCVLPQTLAPGQVYLCQFTATVTGALGSEHKNVLTAAATDDDGAQRQANDDAMVTVVDPRIEASKRDALVQDANNNGVANPGDGIEYTVVVRNVGNSTGSFAFSDLPDANTTLIVGSVTTSQGAITSGNQAGQNSVAVHIGALAPQGSVTIRFRVRVNNPLPVGVIKVANQGQISGGNLPNQPTDDPDTPTPGDPTETLVVASPALAVLKVDELVGDVNENGVANPGDILEYRITVSNNGNQHASNVIFEDMPDSNTTLVVGSVASSAGSIIKGNKANDSGVQVNIGQLASGANVIITFQVRVNDPLLATVTRVENQGITTSTQLPPVLSDDPETPQAGDPTVTPVRSAPQLAVSKRATLLTDQDNDKLPSPGDTILYAVTIVNHGNAPAGGVNYTDTVDSHTTLTPGSVQSSQGTVTKGNAVGDKSLAVNIGLLNSQASVTIRYRVTINSPLPAEVEELVNQGIVKSNETLDEPSDDPNQPGEHDPTRVSVVAKPQLQMSKRDVLFTDADGNNQVSRGDTLLYVITIVNTGNGAALGVLFSDTPDPQTKLVNGTVQTSQGAVTKGNAAGDQSVAVNIGTLPANATVTIGFRVTISQAAGNEVVNQALVRYNAPGASGSTIVDAPSDDPDSSEEEDPTRTPIVGPPTALPGEPEPGERPVRLIFLPMVER